MWKNLFPQGTRTVELCSAYGLIILSIFSLFNNFTVPEFISVEPKLEWSILFALFGGLHLFSLIFYPKIELLRVVSSWLAGCFWIYVGVSSSIIHTSPDDIASIMLGIGNLYGFVLNFNLLKVTWKL